MDINLDEFSDADYLAHYGILRKSGRYPWGSGDNPYQRNQSFLQYVDEMRKKGLSEAKIAEGMGVSTTALRAAASIAKTQKREADIMTARRWKEKGMSNVAIGERMGIPESSVRNLLNPSVKERNDILNQTANVLKSHLADGGYLDVGVGTENHLGISESKKKIAIAMLQEEGYEKFWVKVPQLGTNNETNVMVLAPPGTKFTDVVNNKDQIRSVASYSEDGGRSFTDIVPPKMVDSNRVAVRYAEDGGADKDGVIELRRGVDDISLGAARYAQVRIGVNGTHYLKGMAVYGDNLPKGVDMVFNTNKSKAEVKTPLDAMKPIKNDEDLPFGSIVRQKHYLDKDGKQQLSALNIVGGERGDGSALSGEEGYWNTWSKTLSSQMLSKQNPSLAAKQLDLSYKIKKEEFDEIMTLTNPAVKKKLLQEFADNADSSAVHLKAAGLPRTSNHVILPINSLKDNEVYAPNFTDGETVVLIRHPHGGIFEIPELKVNNRNPEANKIIKNAKDAVGINSKVAERLSGADFDGDTVLVIPNNTKGGIKTAPQLNALKNFDPKMYKLPDDTNIPPMKNKQKQMGDVSNLITDMTIKGANMNEIARAVKHSMVVIDAEKHNLNYRQSAIDNGIAELKKEYQGRSDAGASTLISKAKGELRVGERTPRKAKDGGPINPATGEKMWEYTGETYEVSRTNKKGVVTTKTVPRTTLSTKMAEAKDAHSLSSGTVMEDVYANYANKMKSLANLARKADYETKPTTYSPSAKKAYANEVESLNRKLSTAQSNAPLERQAQIIAGAAVKARVNSNPGLDKDQVKKIKGQELTKARIRVGAKKEVIKFTPSEWAAAQAGAITNNKLTAILGNADMDVVRQLATPRDRPAMTSSKIARARSMIAAGYTMAEIANALGVSTTTIHNAL